jgi:hypothetical protein
MNISRMRADYAQTPNFGNPRGFEYLDLVADPTTSTATLARPCAVNFWTFAIPAMLGSSVAHGVGLIVKRWFNGDHEHTQEAAMLATKFGAFWLVAGFAWIAMSKRNGEKK